MFPGAQLALIQIMTWHRTGDKTLSESITPLFTDTYMRLSTIMPGYLLGAKPFPGPRQINPPEFILNCTHNEHELDPKLCVFIEHYDISKPFCGH